jgi:hypothetical protein
VAASGSAAFSPIIATRVAGVDIVAVGAGACWGALALTPTYGLCVHGVEASSLKALPTVQELAMGGAGFDGARRVAALL